MALLFESTTCGRCGGSGQYSYCRDHGTRCFKCGGKGVTLTKRGHAAQAYYRDLLSVKVGELKIGDLVESSNLTHGGQSFQHNATVVSVEPLTLSGASNGVPYEKSGYAVKVTSKYGDVTHNTFADAKFIVRNRDDRAAKVEQALAYQANLTKQGTVRKNQKTA